jgi:hypothetical protein
MTAVASASSISFSDFGCQYTFGVHQVIFGSEGSSLWAIGRMAAFDPVAIAAALCCKVVSPGFEFAGVSCAHSEFNFPPDHHPSIGLFG